jgi:hypothetical protein
MVKEGRPANTSHISPPFLVSYTPIARDASLGTDVQRVTTEMVKKWLFLPAILHQLYATLHNMTIKQVA